MEVDSTLSNECVFKNIVDTRDTNEKCETKELFTTRKSTIQRCNQEIEDEFHSRIYSLPSTDLDLSKECTVKQ